MLMPAAYPVELRTRVVDAHDNGVGTFKELAETFGVGEATVNRWVARRRRTGSLERTPTGGHRGSRLFDDAAYAFIEKRLTDMPDLTLRELAVAYERHFGTKVAHQRMSEAAKRLGFHRKRGSFVRSPG